MLQVPSGGHALAAPRLRTCHILWLTWVACPAPVLQPDAGLKCPFCREFVDGFTDMNGCAAAAARCLLARRAAARPAAATACPAAFAGVMRTAGPSGLLLPARPTQVLCRLCKIPTRAQSSPCAGGEVRDRARVPARP